MFRIQKLILSSLTHKVKAQQVQISYTMLVCLFTGYNRLNWKHVNKTFPVSTIGAVYQGYGWMGCNGNEKIYLIE